MIIKSYMLIGVFWYLVHGFAYICTRAKDLCKPEVPHHCVIFENILDTLSRSKYSWDGVTLVLHETSLSCINVAVQVQSSCIYMLTIVIIHVCIINYQNLWPTKVERTGGKQSTQKYKTLHTHMILFQAVYMLFGIGTNTFWFIGNARVYNTIRVNELEISIGTG